MEIYLIIENMVFSVSIALTLLRLLCLSPGPLSFLCLSFFVVRYFSRFFVEEAIANPPFHLVRVLSLGRRLCSV